jgi:DNA-binding winged helix-turn-helix (wHTH) protein
VDIIYRINDALIFTPSLFKLHAPDQEIKLSNKETDLLDRLCKDAGNVVQRNELLDFLWPRQDSANTNLNRVVLSLRRKFETLGHNNVIETIPRVGYMVIASVSTITADEIKHDVVTKYQPLGKRRNLFYGLAAAIIITAGSSFTLYCTNERLHTPTQPEIISIHSRTASLYVVKNALNDERTIIKETLLSLSKSINEKDGHLSLLIGKQVISYAFMNKATKYTSNRVYLIKSDQPLQRQIDCITKDLAEQIKNKAIRGISNTDEKHVKIYFYSGCSQDAYYVETDQQRRVITNQGSNLIFATITGLDKERNILFKVDSIGTYERHADNSPINMKINHYMINTVDQNVLMDNPLIIRIISAYRAAGQTAVYIKLKNGLYYFNYMDGILLPIEIEKDNKK